MCQKGSQIFKSFYAVMLTSSTSVPPKALHVFKKSPTKAQMSELIGKMPVVVNVYDHTPKVHVVPINIPVDILYR